MGDLPKRLEAAWKARHKVESEEAFAEAARTGTRFDEGSRKASFFARDAEPVTSR